MNATQRRRAAIALRPAQAADAPALHAFIARHFDEGHLLPRSLDEVTAHVARFVVAARGRRIVGCADLVPLSRRVAEVRSLVVEGRERSSGVGTMLIDELKTRARHGGFEKLCAFTHAPAYFIPMGFSIVPHLWLVEKMTTDCVTCVQFHRCGQYAMVAPLVATAFRSFDPARGVLLDRSIVEGNEQPRSNAAVAEHA